MSDTNENTNGFGSSDAGNHTFMDEPQIPADLEFAPLPVMQPAFWAPTLQQLVGAAERLQNKKVPGFDENTDWMMLVERTRDRMLRERFEAFPLSGFIQRKNNKERVLAVTHPADRLVEEALLPVLIERMESISLPCSHAYRPGRGSFTAAMAAREALLQIDAPHICIVDIADFFPSVDRELLRRELSWAPERMVSVIMQLLAAPVRLRGQDIQISGLPLGCPLSPVLANLYLHAVDMAMKDVDAVYLRFADDICLMAKDSTALDAALEALSRALSSRGLRIKDEKTRRFVFEGTPFAWLGHYIDRNGIYDRIPDARLERIGERAREAARPGQDGSNSAVKQADAVTRGLNEHYRTLYITGQAIYVQVKDGYVECRKGNQLLRRVAMHRISRVVYMATGSFSSGFFASCINRRIPIIYYSGKGKGYAVLIPEGNFNSLRLRAQFDLRSDPVRRLAVARSILQAKCDAMIHRIGQVSDFQENIDNIRKFRNRMADAREISSLVGLEGAATQEYFRVFRMRILRPDFDFFKRSRRPPLDPINSLMSFVYALLFSEFETCLIFHGLDPHPGFLHELHRAHAALASDLMEPYRAIVADPLILRIVNQRMVQKEGFEKQQGGAVYMTAETRKIVLNAYEKHTRTPIGGKASAGTPRQLVYGAVNAMLSLILGETSELHLPLKWESCQKREPYIVVAGEDEHGIVPEALRVPDSEDDPGCAPPPFDPNVDT